MVFQREMVVGYSDLNQEGFLSLFSLCNHFQDTSSAQGEACGQGNLQLLARGRSWFLVYGETVVYRRPSIGEEVLLTTWPTKAQGFFGERAYVMQTKDGERLARCSTVWVLMDMEHGRPTKLTEAELFGKELGEALPALGKGRKIQVPEDLAAWGEDRVNYLFLDSNRHMNNAYYIGLTEQFMQGTAVKSVRVEYKKAAVAGDCIYYRGSRSADRVVVVLENEAAAVFAIVEYGL